MTAKLHPDCSMVDYVRDNILDVATLSGSTLVKLVHETPRHAQVAHARLNPLWRPSATKAGDLGSAAHSALLEGNLDAVAFVAAPDFRTKAAREERDLMIAAGRPVVLLGDRPKVDAMLNEAMAYMTDAGFVDEFTAGVAEVTVTWDENGADCRIRPDTWLEGESITDYKTGRTSDPHAFCRGAMRDYHYDLKAAFQMRGAARAAAPVKVYRFLVQEQTEPYTCSHIEIGEERLDLLNEQMEYGLDRWRTCMKNGNWPGRPAVVHRLGLDAWMSDAWDGRMIEEGR